MLPTPLTIRGIVIGQGRPKTIVPTTGANAATVLQQIGAIAGNPAADMIEWRLDYLDIATNASALIALGQQIQRVTDGKPVIATFRTQAEGGARAINDTQYGQLLGEIIRTRVADLVDVEMFRDQAVVTSLIGSAHDAGLSIILSNHDFSGTPSVEEIVSRLRHQDALGGDVLKIAVMPKHAGDVLTLLDATQQVRNVTTKPLLTMSMGALGLISRFAGETFGSSMTFGMIGQASAPGQIDVSQLHGVLEVLHTASQ